MNVKLERNKKGRLKRLTKAQRDEIGLNKMPKDRYSESETVKLRKTREYSPRLSDE